MSNRTPSLYLYIYVPFCNSIDLLKFPFYTNNRYFTIATSDRSGGGPSYTILSMLGIYCEVEGEGARWAGGGLEPAVCNHYTEGEVPGIHLYPL